MLDEPRPPTPPSRPEATTKQTPSPPPTDGGVGDDDDDDDDDDNGTAVRAPCNDRAAVLRARRSVLHRMEAAGCRPCLGQLRRLRRPLVVRRLTVAGTAADDDAHATRGDDEDDDAPEAVGNVIGGGDRTEVVRRSWPRTSRRGRGSGSAATRRAMAPRY